MRTIFFKLGFVLLTSFYALLFLPGLLLLPQRHFWILPWVWSLTTVKWLKISVGIDYKVIGGDKLPERPFIVASKHQSAWETLVFNVIFKDVVFVMKKELCSIPILGWYLRCHGNIPVDRKAGRKALTDLRLKARETLNEGRIIALYPQGTRTAIGDTETSYKSGIVSVYNALPVLVVPVALNSGYFWPKKGKMRTGTITVEILEPLASGLTRKVFMEQLETSIETASTKLEHDLDSQGASTRLE